jgi:hypothetical protein
LLCEASQHFLGGGRDSGGQTFFEWVAQNFTDPWTGEPMQEECARRLMQKAVTR